MTNDVVRLTSALDRVDAHLKGEKEMPNLKRRHRFNSAGYQRGREAADAINIQQRGVTGSTTPRTAITKGDDA